MLLESRLSQVNPISFAGIYRKNFDVRCKIFLDTIFNHMAGIESGTGTAGSSFTHYNYPGIYQNQVW
jgi:hypothetical protein